MNTDNSFETLRFLGFDPWFEEKAEPDKMKSFRPSRVIAVDKESVTVKDDRFETRAQLTGKLMYASDSPLDFPAVGDWVYVQYLDDGDFAVVHQVFPRKSVLKRKTAGKKTEHQLIAANIDTAFAVQSLDGDLNPRRLERYLSMIYDGGVRPVVLLTKRDLFSPEDVARKIDALRESVQDAEIIAFSNKIEDDMGKIREQLSPGRTYCLLGSSGVGKTTLINNLVGDDRQFDVNEVRAKDGKGRHTTTRRHLIVLDSGAMIVDTPGIRELGNIGFDSGIDEAFGDIAALASMCRFRDCTHENEKGCAVLAALEDGRISHKRFENYLKMKKESDYHARSYLERKQRDKQFGKLCKSVMKNKVKK